MTDKDKWCIDAEMMAQIRKMTPDMIAKEIVAVQPIYDDMFKKLSEAAKSEEQLKAEGYKPVSKTNLLWIKEK